MAFDIMQLLRGVPNMMTGQGQGTPNMLTNPTAPQQGGFMDKLQGFSRSPIGQNIQNAMLGWAMGGNVQDSLGKGAQMVAMGRQQRQGDQNINQTVEWLKSKGMAPNQATAIASNPAVLTDVLKSMLDPNAALDSEFKRAQIENIQSQIDERNNPSVRDQFGLNPIYGKDENGNLVVMQPSKAGGLVKADIPEGVTLQPGVDKMDLGTSWGITDRSGNIISVVPKDLAGAEEQKARGGKQGDAAFDLPRVEQNAQQTLGILERMKSHPGREGSTGFFQGMLPSRSSDQVDFQSLVDQTKGQSFLQAFQMLKGAGQITEIEGEKATNAISRLGNQRLSDADYLRAITDLEDVIKAGLERAKVQAGQGGGPKRLKFDPATGTLQ
jgi:hypothetical protein